MNNRKEDLLNIFKDVDSKEIIIKLIEDIVFLEERLEELRKLPMVRINPNDPTQQKATPASKLYKEFLQQYNNTVKNLASFIRKTDSTEESPLEIYLKNLNNN